MKLHDIWVMVLMQDIHYNLFICFLWPIGHGVADLAVKYRLSCFFFPSISCNVAILHSCSDVVHIKAPAAHCCRKCPVMNHNVLWGHRQPEPEISNFSGPQASIPQKW